MFLNPFDVPKNTGEVGGGGQEVINFMVIRHLKCKAMHAFIASAWLIHRLSLAMKNGDRHPVHAVCLRFMPKSRESSQNSQACVLLHIQGGV